MIVNETKTKVMTFGKKNNCNVYFNDKQIEQVAEYKYLGNIVRSVRTDKQDIFSPNYTYLRDRANRAIFLVSRKLRNIEHPPPKIMFDIFDTLIMPILSYGSDVWGSNKDSIDILDKVFLRFIRCTLGIKATTSNIIVAGECGRLPPSTQCILHTLCYVNRIIHMNGTSLVKQVYDELNDLSEQGFNNWVTSLHNLADEYQIDLSLEPDDFHRICKSSVRTKYIEQWSSCMMQFDRFPLLRTYRGIKLAFRTEPYLYLVKKRRFRNAISQLRASSHTLQIERGRYTKPQMPVNERICIVCQCLEDDCILWLHVLWINTKEIYFMTRSVKSAQSFLN